MRRLLLLEGLIEGLVVVAETGKLIIQAQSVSVSLSSQSAGIRLQTTLMKPIGNTHTEHDSRDKHRDSSHTSSGL
jgi:hypothetical protein